MGTVSKDQPIGIFDSGIGGLTVAHAIKKMMPLESLVYFGDTAHLPYGDKSEAAIQAYSIKIADVLLKNNCKVIVIACNSASSAAYELLKEYVHQDVKVINVIDPMVSWVGEKYSHCNIGLIGTKRTVQSGIYSKKIESLNKGIKLHALPAPLLVPMIEEGFFNNKISHDIIEKYLKYTALQDIKALILGCTHYPLIKNEINTFYGSRVDVLDSSEAVASALFHYLKSSDLLSPSESKEDHFLVSDYTDSFEASTKLFFHSSVHLEKHPLWGQ
ncbi:MAG TPA: glutamate racemase [Cyclobacteriaceae bacterium]|nr:glutamate racemase [Cyclobacteriaceae bacterium]